MAAAEQDNPFIEFLLGAAIGKLKTITAGFILSTSCGMPWSIMN